MSLALRPITLREACAFVDKQHRHHRAPQGCKFCLAAVDGQEVVGVIVCGRPVARNLDDGVTVEVTRLATNGARNACSFLYGAAQRVAKAMGYNRIITYTLASEDGASLRASNWQNDGVIKGQSWNRQNRERTDKHPTCDKRRWSKELR